METVTLQRNHMISLEKEGLLNNFEEKKFFTPGGDLHFCAIKTMQIKFYGKKGEKGYPHKIKKIISIITF